MINRPTLDDLDRAAATCTVQFFINNYLTKGEITSICSGDYERFGMPKDGNAANGYRNVITGISDLVSVLSCIAGYTFLPFFCCMSSNPVAVPWVGLGCALE